MKVKEGDQVLVPATVVAVGHRDGEEDPTHADIKLSDGQIVASVPTEDFKHDAKKKEKE